MKMYGFAYAMGFPCLCFGKKAWYFKLIWWSPIKKRPVWYSWWSETKSVWWQRVNSYPFRFFGVMILPNEEIYDLED
jgi:hypothetical protein